MHYRMINLMNISTNSDLHQVLNPHSSGAFRPDDRNSFLIRYACERGHYNNINNERPPKTGYWADQAADSRGETFI